MAPAFKEERDQGLEKRVVVVLAVLVLAGVAAYEVEAAPKPHSNVTLSGSVSGIGTATGIVFTSQSGAVYSAEATPAQCVTGFFGDCLGHTYVYSIQIPNNAQYTVTVAQSQESPCNAGVVQVSGNNDTANFSC